LKQFKTIIDILNERERRQPLMPTSVWNMELDSSIQAMDWREAKRETAVIALMAGLHLRNDSLDRSHQYAQAIEYDATGAYWHGIMHRMEGDFSNAKYWFHMAGDHPAMTDTASRISEALQQAYEPDDVDSEQIRTMLESFRDHGEWTPSGFTDIVRWQQRLELSPALRDTLEYMQYIETTTLFQHTLALCSPYIDR